jgi:hypothetical protein
MNSLQLSSAPWRTADMAALRARAGGVARYRPFGQAPDRAAPPDDRDTDFLALLKAFRRSGGLATGDEIAARQASGGVLQLARWIHGREVLNFGWRGRIWLPVFQFERIGLVLCDAPSRAVGELAPVLDGWELANWFTAPHAALDDRSPLDMLPDDPGRVIDAARSSRFLHRG